MLTSQNRRAKNSESYLQKHLGTWVKVPLKGRKKNLQFNFFLQFNFELFNNLKFKTG
jgi:hypothetical protein